jgi:hypothetical protein
MAIAWCKTSALQRMRHGLDETSERTGVWLANPVSPASQSGVHTVHLLSRLKSASTFITGLYNNSLAFNGVTL